MKTIRSSEGLFLAVILALAMPPEIQVSGAQDFANEPGSFPQSRSGNSGNVGSALKRPPTGAEGLTINFRGASLDSVLEYLSDAAGFIINKEAQVRGTVDVWSAHPVQPHEAVELLNEALRKNGYGVIRRGRILTVVSLDEARSADLEVVSGNDPESVAKSAEVVTQVIGVRYANAAQLMANLQPLLPQTATLNVNESANSLILVATKTDINRMLRIISALDNSIASVSSIRVYALRYADARQLATVIQQIFAPQSSTQRGNARGQMFNAAGPGGGGPPGFGPGGFGGAADGGSQARGSQNNRGTTGAVQASRVVAVADETSNSLIVSAAPDLLNSVTDIVGKVDQPVSDVTELRVFKLEHANPEELADQLLLLFPDDSRSGSGQNQNQRRFGPGGQMADNAANSERALKQDRVIAVPDARTSSLLVSASSSAISKIEEMITELDSKPAGKETVKVYNLQNANPQTVNQILQDLFNRNTTMRNNANRTEENDALLNRQTQQLQQQRMNQGFGGGNQGGFQGGAGAP